MAAPGDVVDVPLMWPMATVAAPDSASVTVDNTAPVLSMSAFRGAVIDLYHQRPVAWAATPMARA